jgi:hypothetical protein
MVAYLRIKNAILEPKLDSVQSSIARTPPLLDHDFLEIQSTITKLSSSDTSPFIVKNEPVIRFVKNHIRLSGPWIALADICSKTRTSETGASFEQEVEECFKILQGKSTTFLTGT